MELPGPWALPANLLPQDGELFYRENFLDPDQSLRYLEDLADSVPWEKPSIKLWGKLIPVPRLTAWIGDPEATYVYSGILNHPSPWTPEIREIKKLVEKETQRDFNSVLVNYYRDGNDHMSWHADDERGLGHNPLIASVSLGGPRKFGVKHRRDSGVKTLSLELASGSLLLMGGEMQRHWHHRIYPTKRIASPRINLTFRKIISG